MALTIPNVAAATYGDQAAPDSVDIDAIVAGSAETGVVSGCAVAQRAAGANMSVDVAAGTAAVAGTSVAVSAINKTITSADATNPRRDIITVTNAGVVTVTNGTAAAIPVKPAIPANSALLAEVYVPANATSVVTAQITDKRSILGSPILTTLKTYLTADVTISTANTYFDGPSLSLAAGVWFLYGQVLLTASSAAARTFLFRLWDGTTDVSNGAHTIEGSLTASQSSWPLAGIVVPSTTTTYKISATSNTGTTDKIAHNGQKGSFLLALKIG